MTIPLSAGGFDSDLAIRGTGPTTWGLLAPLIWTGTKGDQFAVPVGFETDFATVPRFLAWKVLPYGPYTRAAVLHDWLLQKLAEWMRDHPDLASGRAVYASTDPLTGVTEIAGPPANSRDCDGIFRLAMKDLGTPWLTRWQMWAAVRLAACFNHRRAYGRQFWRDAPAVFGMLLVSFPFVILGAAGVLISLALAWPFDRLQRPARARAHA